MIKTVLSKKITAISITVILTLIVVGAGGSATKPLSTTELSIEDIKGGFGKVILEVKNVGNVTAEDIELGVKVTGGFLDRINLEKICTGCSDCGTTLDPGAMRTESTVEEKRLFGFGQLDIEVYANASNANIVEDNANGFIIGFLVIVT